MTDYSKFVMFLALYERVGFKNECPAFTTTRALLTIRARSRPGPVRFRIHTFWFDPNQTENQADLI